MRVPVALCSPYTCSSLSLALTLLVRSHLCFNLHFLLYDKWHKGTFSYILWQLDILWRAYLNHLQIFLLAIYHFANVLHIFWTPPSPHHPPIYISNSTLGIVSIYMLTISSFTFLFSTSSITSHLLDFSCLLTDPCGFSLSPFLQIIPYKTNR